MFYRTAGDEDNSPVILLHGIAGSGDTTWYGTYDALSENYYIIAPDLRGHGLSMKPEEDYTLSQMALDVIALMEVLEIEQAHLIAHSMGGGVALELYQLQPESVESLVLISTTANWQGYPQFQASFLLYPSVIRARNRLTGWDYENRVRANSITSDEVAPEYFEWIYQKRAFNDSEAFIAALNATKQYDATDIIDDVDVPLLVIYGAEDEVVPAQLQEDFIALTPGAEHVVIEDGDHYLQNERASTVNPEILAFLNAH